MRLDLFLKTCRLVKRRAVAREMCESDRVLVNDHAAKPAKEVKPGDKITLLFSSKSVELEVLALPAQRSIQKIDIQDLYRVTAETRHEPKDQEWIKNLSSS